MKWFLKIFKWLVPFALITPIVVPAFFFFFSSNLNNLLGIALIEPPLVYPTNFSYNGSTTTTQQNYKVIVTETWDGAKTQPWAPGQHAHFQNILWSFETSSSSAYWKDNTVASNDFAIQTQTGNIQPLENDLNKQNVAHGFKTGNIYFQFTYSFEITVKRSAPYLTMSSKLTPSPDWFWGLSSFSLIADSTQSQPGAWLTNYHYNILLYSSGTKDPRYSPGKKIIKPIEMQNENRPYGILDIQAL